MLKRDNYTDIVYELRSIRESQRISQQEMAGRLKVSQETVSKFESVKLNVKPDFLLAYASTLGYSIVACKEEDMAKPLPLNAAGADGVSVNDRVKRLIPGLLEIKSDRVKAILIKYPGQDFDDVNEAFTRLIAKTFKWKEDEVRQLETDGPYIPDAYFVFHYANYFRVALRLSDDLQPQNIIGQPASSIDKYSEFISVLRGIRESYRVTQAEMAALMDVEQSTVSKFESAKLDIKPEFLILYASLLGYNIKVGSTFMSRGELPRFRRRQSRIAKTLRCIQRWQIEGIFNSDVYGRTWWPGDAVRANKSRIISELRNAKKAAGLTTKKLSEKLGVSDRTVRRFERENYAPSASFVFKYAALVNMELRLEKNLRCKREVLGAFYIRRSLVLHNWLRNLADTGCDFWICSQ